MRKVFKILLAVGLLTFSPAAEAKPNLQEMRAQQTAQAEAARKKQEVEIFKKRREELLIQHKTLMQEQATGIKQTKIAENDYRKAVAQLTNAKNEAQQLEARMNDLRKNAGKMDRVQMQKQLDALQKAHQQVYNNMKIYQTVQDQSFAQMNAAANQTQIIETKIQMIRNQVDQVQRQLEFVISQP